MVDQCIRWSLSLPSTIHSPRKGVVAIAYYFWHLVNRPSNEHLFLQSPQETEADVAVDEATLQIYKFWEEHFGINQEAKRENIRFSSGLRHCQAWDERTSDPLLSYTTTTLCSKWSNICQHQSGTKWLAMQILLQMLDYGKGRLITWGAGPCMNHVSW